MSDEPNCAVCGHEPYAHPGHDCEDPCEHQGWECQGYAPRLDEYLRYREGSVSSARLKE